MNILRFQTNVPNEVSLESSQGVVVQGRYGDRMMFTLSDGQVMYVPPIVANKITAEGIGPGERFELCKAQVKIGQRRTIEWSVRRLEPEEPRAEERSDVVPETQLESDLRASVEMASAKNGKEPSAVVADSAASIAPSNGDISATAVPAPPVSPPLTKLESALKTAIAAAHNAEKFGAEIGYVVRFDSDAIKSMAITVLINMSEGSRRWAN